MRRHLIMKIFFIEFGDIVCGINIDKKQLLRNEYTGAILSVVEFLNTNSTHDMSLGICYKLVECVEASFKNSFH